MNNQFQSLIFFFLMTSMTVACAQWDGATDTAKGPVTKQQFNLDEFTGVGLTLAADVYIRQGSRQSVEIEAKESVLENITTDVRSGFWKIGFEKRMRNYGEITVWITMPTLDKLSVSGSGSIIGKSDFEDLDQLVLNISGSGNISLDANAEDLNCVVTGSGDMSLAGRVNTQKYSVTGSGDIESFDLKAKESVVRITGSGDCEVNVSDRLEVYITGSGDVDYKGDPSVKSRITGSGDVRGRD